MDIRNIIVVVVLVAAGAWVAFSWGEQPALAPALEQEPTPIEEEEEIINLPPTAPGPLGELSLMVGERVARYAARDLGLSTKDIFVTRVGGTTWPDSCLHLPLAGEVCAQVVTPGHRVRVEARGTLYIYRTNIDGTNIRRE